MSEEIMAAAGLLDANAVQRRQIAAFSADLARARADLAAATHSRDQALASAEAERAARVRCESQLGAARVVVEAAEVYVYDLHTRESERRLEDALVNYDEAIGKEAR